MSIALQKQIDDLKLRVATMESLVKQLYAYIQAPTLKPAPRETLTLEKRKSA